MNENMQSTGNVFVDYLINEGVYGKGISITEDNIKDLIQLIGGHVNINMYCPECRHESVFCGNPILHFRAINSNINIPYCTGDSQKHYLADTISENIGYAEGFAIWNYDIKDNTRIMTFKFDCAKDDSNHHLDYVVIIENNNMKKIGQYPSMADLSYPELKKYRRIIGEENEKELKRACGLFASGIGVGSFVYLRRIFERIIVIAENKAISENKIDEEEIKKANVTKKIKMLSEYLPDLMIDNTVFYGIVSSGIHELSENECLGYFPILYSFIILILNKWKSLQDENIIEEQIKKDLNKIHSEIKNKK